MRIQTLIFTALLFILPTIAVGAATNCPIQNNFTKPDENGNPIDDKDAFKQACTDTPGCEYIAISKKCSKCPADQYKSNSNTACQACTNKPNADAARYLTTEDYAGMQANICPWDLTCDKNTQFIQQNNSCQACPQHQYNEKTYVIYNIKGVQSGSPGYTYKKINDNGTYGAQLSSAPKCENKKMKIQLNKPCNTEGCTLSGAPLNNEYECKSSNNNLPLTLANGYYTLVGYSINKAEKVKADYQCTNKSNCYNLDQICNNPDQPNGTTIYAIWKPETYTIYYYFGNTILQTVNADFSTKQSITDTNIKNTIRTWSKFDIYEEVDDEKQEKLSEQNKIGATIPHPKKAGNNIYIKILCPAGYYCKKDKYDVTNMTLCPDGKTSDPGSTKETDCTNEAYTTFCDLNGCMTLK